MENDFDYNIGIFFILIFLFYKVYRLYDDWKWKNTNLMLFSLSNPKSSERLSAEKFADNYFKNVINKYPINSDLVFREILLLFNGNKHNDPSNGFDKYKELIVLQYWNLYRDSTAELCLAKCCLGLLLYNEWSGDSYRFCDLNNSDERKKHCLSCSSILKKVGIYNIRFAFDCSSSLSRWDPVSYSSHALIFSLPSVLLSDDFYTKDKKIDEIFILLFKKYFNITSCYDCSYFEEFRECYHGKPIRVNNSDPVCMNFLKKKNVKK